MTQAQPEPDGRFDVFISYSRQDVTRAEELHSALEGTDLTVWRDKTRLEAGDHVVPTISTALRNSTAVVVLWSENATQSRWVQKEADYAEVAGKYLPLAVDGFNYSQLDSVFREYNCGALAAVVADARAFKQRILALRAAPYAGQQIRHPDIRPVPGFIGREEMLGALEEKLWQSSGTGSSAVALRNADDAVVAMRGLGGVGKTVLARHYAWEARERYHGIWWLRAEAEETLIDDLIALGRRMQLDIPADMEPEDAARLTLDAVAQGRKGKPWLLVYDNVEDKTLVRRLTPPENAHIIYTTRQPNWFGEADELPVDVFPRDIAIDFLLAYAPNETREAAAQLAGTLGRLPLALAHARAYCKSRNKSFDQYRGQVASLLDTMPKDADTDYPNTVYATFSLAMDRAAEECASATDLMGLIAHYAPDQIPLWLIPEAVIPEAARDDALEALQRLSLVAHDALADGTPAISVHRLVQEVVRARLKQAGEADDYLALAFTTAYDAYDFYNDTLEMQARRVHWLPHAITLLMQPLHTPQVTIKIIWTCNFVGNFRISRGELSRAKEAYEIGLQHLKLLTETNPDNTAWLRELSVSHNKIGDVLTSQGNLDAALKSFNASLAIAERLANADPNNAGWQRDLSVSHNKIGDVLKSQGNLDAALKSFNASLAIAERLANADPNNAGWQRDLSVSHNKIGDVLTSQGNLDAALKSFNASLAIAERLANADPNNAGWQRDLALSYGRVAMVEAQQNRAEVALAGFRKGRDIIVRLIEISPDNATLPKDLAWYEAKIMELTASAPATDTARRGGWLSRLWGAGG